MAISETSVVTSSQLGIWQSLSLATFYVNLPMTLTWLYQPPMKLLVIPRSSVCRTGPSGIT